MLRWTTWQIGSPFPNTPTASSPRQKSAASRFAFQRSRSALYYILRKFKGHTDGLALLAKLKQLVHISTVGEAEIHAALVSEFTDFEDAIQHFATKAEGKISAIVTRNKADYSRSKIPVLSPDEYLLRTESGDVPKT